MSFLARNSGVCLMLRPATWSVCSKFSNLAPIKKQTTLQRSKARRPQLFKYFLIFDIEATCDKELGCPPVPEIIDFPVLKVNAATFQIESKFHEFVRPRLYPRISEFCTNMTGITQEDIDNADHLPEVLKKFDTWFKKEVIPSTHLFLTCGDWDMGTQMPEHCRREHMRVPYYMRRWCNIKHSYNAVTDDYSTKMGGVLKGLELERIDTDNKSLDDVHNLRNIALDIANRGHVFEHTRRLDKTVP